MCRRFGNGDVKSHVSSFADSIAPIPSMPVLVLVSPAPERLETCTQVHMIPFWKRKVVVFRLFDCFEHRHPTSCLQPPSFCSWSPTSLPNSDQLGQDGVLQLLPMHLCPGVSSLYLRFVSLLPVISKGIDRDPSFFQNPFVCRLPIMAIWSARSSRMLRQPNLSPAPAMICRP